MGQRVFVFIILIAIGSCREPASNKIEKLSSVEGTWKLLKGTLTENGKVTTTDYTHNVSFIKIINPTHFAFLQHDLSKGKDSLASFSAGGGTYTLTDSSYTEHLEYCSAREWEGKDFNFIISIHNDTLIQKGVERVAEKGINRYNVEEYIRWRK